MTDLCSRFSRTTTITWATPAAGAGLAEEGVVDMLLVDAGPGRTAACPP
jgi:phage tail protein X